MHVNSRHPLLVRAPRARAESIIPALAPRRRSSAVIPKAQWQWREWTEKKRPETRCQAAARAGTGFSAQLDELTVGLLTHEGNSFAQSMESYERHGLFDIVPECVRR